MSYLDSDSINSILSGQEIQRLNVESEKTSGKGIGFMRSIVIHMLSEIPLTSYGLNVRTYFTKKSEDIKSLKGY